MGAFNTFANGDQDIEKLLASRVRDRDEALPDRQSLMTLARLATLVAARIEGHDPGQKRDEWRTYALEMRNSASQLAEDSRRDDRPAMLSSARRLGASCQKCHEVFRGRPYLASADPRVRERFPTRNRIRSYYAARPSVGPTGPGLESTDG
jgi:hypothetical protein